MSLIVSERADGFFEAGQGLGITNIHLISGEDVVGDVFEGLESYAIKRPVLPNVSMNPDNHQFRVGLLPLRPYLGNIEEIEIDKKFVAYKVKCSEQMARLYHQFTSNITLATTLPEEVRT